MAMGVVALVALVAVQLVVTYSLLVGAGRSSTHVLQPDVARTPESMDWHEKGGVKEEQVGSWPGGIMAASAAAAEYSTKEDEQDHNSKTGLSVVQVRDEWEIIPSSASGSDLVKLSNGTEVQLFPSSQPHHGHVNETRRKLGDFQQCSPCTCCDRTRSWCIPLVCCYNIQCDLEGLPFGLCSFIPISCTCFGCSS
ncbi:unnamed protein product [Sphagnum jensenii]|uniref:DUF7866 domain-containing protein n=1 Tax=Sphagnum jensenii TaxID=128206 RepID=A0ABP1ASM7_9BRYO